MSDMTYLGKRNGNWFGVQSISYVYDEEYMTEQQIKDMFSDVEDCCGVLFGLYCDTEDVGVEEMVNWLSRNEYVVVREFKVVS